MGKDPSKSDDDYDKRLWRGRPEDREQALRSRGIETITRTTIESAMSMLRPGSGSTDLQLIERFKPYLKRSASKQFSTDGLCAYAELFLDDDAGLHDVLVAIAERSQQDPDIWNRVRCKQKTKLSIFVHLMRHKDEVAKRMPYYRYQSYVLKMLDHGYIDPKVDLGDWPSHFNKLLAQLDTRNPTNAKV